MAGPDDATGRAAHAAAAGWVGRLLVALQFALLALLAVAALRGAMSVMSVTAAAGLGGAAGPALLRLLAAAGFIAAGAGLGLAAVAANRPGNFHIRPVPRAGGQLVQAGPYRRIRHPMYIALLLAGLGAALLAGAAPGPGGLAGVAWVELGALAVVLALKARVEERALREAHPGYAAYAAGTARFIPGVY